MFEYVFDLDKGVFLVIFGSLRCLSRLPLGSSLLMMDYLLLIFRVNKSKNRNYIFVVEIFQNRQLVEHKPMMMTLPSNNIDQVPDCKSCPL
ncbi:hypothetical protein HanIR_Chr11g0554811 [Helianthus annuus]|nr:hypothetical protein HanIR_Chr11g0554811 [Helianthus annuus]